MRKLLLLLLVLPLWCSEHPPPGTPCTIDPQVGPVTGRVGTELSVFITVTGCAASTGSRRSRSSTAAFLGDQAVFPSPGARE